MKWLIASDIHGSADCCRKLLERFEEEKADRLLLLGDLLYHGPKNALPDGYETMEVSKQLNALKEKILCVRGNCDAEVDREVLAFSLEEISTVFVSGGSLICATHGHVYDEHRRPPIRDLDVLLTGHTHVPALHDYGNFVYINPGSVSIPKGGSSRSYMTLEKGLFVWKTLEGGEYRRFQLTPRHGED